VPMTLRNASGATAATVTRTITIPG
jgi:hypothetical protein